MTKQGKWVELIWDSGYGMVVFQNAFHLEMY
jgi:hypothetical protein